MEFHYIIDPNRSSDIIAQMNAEIPKESGKVVTPTKTSLENVIDPNRNATKIVKNTEISIDQSEVTIDEIGVEIENNQPEDLARIIAHIFRTGKTVTGNYDPRTGKYSINDTD